VAVLSALATGASARPTYFATLRTFFAIPADSRVDTCGVCHERWNGTGARNAFGTTVEQQLYAGRSITDSLTAVRDLDADGDGYTNAEELTAHLTLPGFSCATFEEAVGAPADWHTYITPGVATCLPPLDLRLSQQGFSFLAEVGKGDQASLTVFNNGAELPLVISSYGLLPGAHRAFGVTGPVAPVDIPVGGSVTLTLSFAPTAATGGTAVLRIASNDPDEPTIDLELSGLGFVKSLAPAAERASCRASVEASFRRYATAHLRAWLACAVDEGSGVACRRGARDRVLAREARRLRERVGGPRDRRCAGRNLTPSRLDLPRACGGGCGGIPLASLSTLADCLLCRAAGATELALRALVGTVPPDLPPTTAATRDAAACLDRLARDLGRTVTETARALGRCAQGNLAATEPADCDAVATAARAGAAERLARAQERCTDTSGLAACPFVEPEEGEGTTGEERETCLAETSVEMAVELADAVWATAE
jgi:hypothetical protein